MNKNRGSDNIHWPTSTLFQLVFFVLGMRCHSVLTPMATSSFIPNRSQFWTCFISVFPRNPMSSRRCLLAFWRKKKNRRRAPVRVVFMNVAGFELFFFSETHQFVCKFLPHIRCQHVQKAVAEKGMANKGKHQSTYAVRMALYLF